MPAFNNDYSEGCHPAILEALLSENYTYNHAYGKDIHSDEAAKLICEHIESEDAAVHFLSGGTQTNLIAISSFLKPHEAVIAPRSAHINVHETGAIEYTGHKVLTAVTEDGKISPENIEKILEAHEDEHMVKPKLVYISNATEIGTIYYKEELKELSDFCKKNKLILYMDGARMGHALCSVRNDLTMAEIAEYTDAFYIGGTKNGTLLGEALVITNPSLQDDFRYMIKQKGAMLAKGWIIGMQFKILFKDGLYYELARHADDMAGILIEALKSEGFKMASDSSTNQVFVELPDILINELHNKHIFSIDRKISENISCVRFVTSWATNKEDVKELIGDMLQIKMKLGR